VTLTIAGYSLGFLAGFAVGHVLLGNVMVGIGIGAGVGFFQWRVLRRVVPESRRWILAGAASLGLSLALYALVSFVSGYPMHLGWPRGVLGWAAAFVVGGVLLGSFEREVLRRRVGRADGWIAASAVGWGLSVLALAIPPDMSGELPVALVLVRNGLLAPAAAGAILGVVTGGALIRLRLLPRAGKAAGVA
jgi:hypothetical protein